MAYKIHAEYPFLVLANRDEYYERPTKDAHWWNENPNLLAGKDLKAGGTWLGVTKTGKFCALTNYRAPQNFNPNALSRGNIVADYLSQSDSATDYIYNQMGNMASYNDFNLICYEQEQLYYFGSKEGKIKSLSPGIYGLSNALLDSEWPKVVNGKNELQHLLQTGPISAEKAFDILGNPAVAPDHELPNTGISLEFERMLSAMHIQVEGYGTRSSNVILYQQNGIEFYEKNHLNQSLSNFTIEF
jgi:uncharacterized protein with NRDE domain